MTAPTSYAERRKLQLRDEIIDAAFEVFSERGYHDAGVADIAARVGIGHSTFYRHFDGKRDILDQVISGLIERLHTALAAENAPDAATSLDEYRSQVQRIAEILDDICSDARVVRMLLIQAAGVDVELEKKVYGLFDLAATLTAGYLENGRDRGYLRGDLDCAATAHAVVAMIVGSALLTLNPVPDTLGHDRTIKAAIDLMFDGVSG
ncbi:MAG TPA: TetR/AcrR family transcriptional regulator [Mycobacterium sp.]|nr:TetR/AcrR family transcriptional regulator [Mycobacterium sp.]